MREIEIKAKISDTKTIHDKLVSLGCVFSDSTTQEDLIFLPVGINFSDIIKGTPVVRIRNTDGLSILTLKKRIATETELVKLEKEVITNNKDETAEIVKHMGFYEAVRVNKKRIQCDYKEMTICLDEVENLGCFIEVEKMSEDGGEEVQRELADFLISLDIDKENFVTKGYDTLIYEKSIS